jgi:hypothetical protein
LSGALGTSSEALVLGCLFVGGLAVAPLVLLGLAAVLTRLVTQDGTTSSGRVALRYAYGFVPFGFGMWLAHYGFHLLTGVFTVIPIAQNVVVDLWGRSVLGEPVWRLTGMRPGAVYPIQLGFIVLGAMGSLALAYRISERDYPDRPALPTAPWAVVTMTLTTVAVWILSQPMEMRGAWFMG